MSEKPFMYTNMTEARLLGWALDYNFEETIDTFSRIHDDRVCIRPAPNIQSPGWTFAHIVVTERFHVGWAVEGVDDVPEPFWVFRDHSVAESRVKQVLESKTALIEYWCQVRRQTHLCLDSLSDEMLKEVPKTSLLPPNDPNRRNPIREWFLMTIQHQEFHWGQLEMMRDLIK